MKRTLLLAAAILCAAISPAMVRADGEPWQFRVTPYGWAPTLHTDLAIGVEPPTSTETSLLDVLDLAFLFSAEARKGDWAVIGEFNYLALSQKASSPEAKFGAKVSVEGVMWGAAVAYRLYEDDLANVDGFGGFRAWSLDMGVDFNRVRSFSAGNDWVDPIVGVRGRYKLTDTVFVDGLAEIGGFGVGSDFQWELIGRAGYRINDTVSLAVGYRHLALDFGDGGLVFDAAMTGPFAAVDFNF